MQMLFRTLFVRTAATAFCLFCLTYVVVAAPLGWRGDGTGKFPEATPPLEWSLEDNVIWKTPMSGFSNSSPIMVGERIFVKAEPSSLIALSAQYGHVIWQRTHNFTDMVNAETRAQWAVEQAKADEVRDQMYTAGGQLRRLMARVQDNPDDEELKAEYEAMRKKREDLGKQMLPLELAWYMMPETHEENGYTSPTPVSDGERVYAIFGTGWTVCYDLEGNQLWAKMVEKPRMHHGFSASPVLVDNKLIVHIHHVHALDKMTGETIWQTEDETWSWGTPTVTSIGDTTVLFTGWGDMIRAADGKVVASGMPRMLMQGPTVEGDVVYYIDKGAWKAYKLPQTIASDEVELELLWDVDIDSQTCYASPIVHDGLLYSWDNSGTVRVLEAATGELVYEKKLDIGERNTWYYPSVTLAGDKLFISADITGTTMVINPGREYDEAARNPLENFCSSLVFVGDRMFVRTWDHLFCIGPLTEEAGE